MNTVLELWQPTRRNIRRFIKLAASFYSDYPHYVQPLLLDTLGVLDPTRNPILTSEETIFLVAKRDRKVIGTLMGYSRFIKEVNAKKAFWCHFESINDQTVATLLFDGLQSWGKAHGFHSMYGPEEPRFDEFSRGLLVQGFDDDPAVFNPYHPPYYETLIQGAGFAKHKDFYAYELTFQTFNSERVERVMQYVKDRYKLTIDILDLKQTAREAKDMAEIVRRATPIEWDFHVPSEKEIIDVINTMKLFYLPGLCFIARTQDQQPVGVVLGIPDIYQILKPHNGNLLPFGILSLLTQKKKITRGRVFMQYVAPDYQGLGVNVLIFYEMWKYLKTTKSSMVSIDGSTIGEENIKSFQSVINSGGKLSKIYREYEKII